MTNKIVRKGNPFTVTGLERLVVKNMTSARNTKRRSGRLFASSAGQCPRRNALHASEDNESTFGPASRMYTAIGTSVHTVIQDAMFRSEQLLFSEYHLPAVGLNLGGYVDMIALIDGKITVVEIKTCGKLPASPKSDHRLQAMIYSVVTGLPAQVLYQSRDVAGFDKALHLKSFKIEETTGAYMGLLKSLVLSHEAIRLERVPPIPIAFKSKRDCGYCPFIDLCWNAQQTQWPELSASQLRELAPIIDARARELWDDRYKRRNGILRFLSKHGTVYAQRLLDGQDWSAYL